MSNKQKTTKEVVIYQSKSGAIELKGDFTHETVWATQAQIAKVFGVTPQNITMHIKNVYKEKELLEKATCKKSLQAFEYTIYKVRLFCDNSSTSLYQDSERK